MRVVTVFGIVLMVVLGGCGVFSEAEVTPTATAVLVLPTLRGYELVSKPPATPSAPVTEPVSESNGASGTTAVPGITPSPSPTAGLAGNCTGLPPGWTFAYTVRAGDTLSRIAQRTGVSIANIRAENCLASDFIFIGQRLYLPASVATQSNVGGTSPPIATIATPSFSEATPEAPPIPTLPIGTPVAPGPGGERVTVSPLIGQAGTVFTIVIEGFRPNETLTLRIIHVETFTPVVDEMIIVNGLGNYTFYYYSPPDAAAGNYNVSAASATVVKDGQFTITAPQPTITNTPPLPPPIDTPLPPPPTETLPPPADTPLPTSPTDTPTPTVTATPVS